MDVHHTVTDADRQPENAETALRARQEKEDAETLRVRGPQRPADQVAPAPEPLPSRLSVSPTSRAAQVSPVLVRPDAEQP